MAKILIVDDDPIIVEILTAKFRADGHQVISMADAYSATPAAVNFKPDLITLDFEMPAGNGFTVLARLRGNTATAKTPIIFISGRALSDRRPFSPDPNVRFLQKPVNIAKLEICVAELLKNEAAPDGDPPGGDLIDLDREEP